MLFLFGVAWWAMFNYLYLRREDVASILAGRPHAHAWGQVTVLGLRKFLEASNPSLGRGGLKKSGYVVMTPSGLEFWQRVGKSLNRILVIPRSVIDSVERKNINAGFQFQEGVVIHIEIESGAREDVPILLKGAAGVRSWGNVPENFVAQWNALST